MHAAEPRISPECWGLSYKVDGEAIAEEAADQGGAGWWGVRIKGAFGPSVSRDT